MENLSFANFAFNYFKVNEREGTVPNGNKYWEDPKLDLHKITFPFLEIHYENLFGGNSYKTIINNKMLFCCTTKFDKTNVKVIAYISMNYYCFSKNPPPHNFGNGTEI